MKTQTQVVPSSAPQANGAPTTSPSNSQGSESVQPPKLSPSPTASPPAPRVSQTVTLNVMVPLNSSPGQILQVDYSGVVVPLILPLGVKPGVVNELKLILPNTSQLGASQPRVPIPTLKVSNGTAPVIGQQLTNGDSKIGVSQQEARILQGNEDQAVGVLQKALRDSQNDNSVHVAITVQSLAILLSRKKIRDFIMQLNPSQLSRLCRTCQIISEFQEQNPGKTPEFYENAKRGREHLNFNRGDGVPVCCDQSVLRIKKHKTASELSSSSMDTAAKANHPVDSTSSGDRELPRAFANTPIQDIPSAGWRRFWKLLSAKLVPKKVRKLQSMKSTRLKQKRQLNKMITQSLEQHKEVPKKRKLYSIFWSEDGGKDKWYTAVCTGLPKDDPNETGRYCFEYKDGTEEWVDFHMLVRKGHIKAKTKTSEKKASTPKSANKKVINERVEEREPPQLDDYDTFIKKIYKAIDAIEDEKGATEYLIKKWMFQRYKDMDEESFKDLFKTSVKKALDEGVLEYGKTYYRYKVPAECTLEIMTSRILKAITANDNRKGIYFHEIEEWIHDQHPELSDERYHVVLEAALEMALEEGILKKYSHDRFRIAQPLLQKIRNMHGVGNKSRKRKARS